MNTYQPGITAETNPLLALIKLGSPDGYKLYSSFATIATSPGVLPQTRNVASWGALFSLFIAGADAINKIPDYRAKNRRKY